MYFALLKTYHITRCSNQSHVISPLRMRVHVHGNCCMYRVGSSGHIPHLTYFWQVVVLWPLMIDRFIYHYYFLTTKMSPKSHQISCCGLENSYPFYYGYIWRICNVICCSKMAGVCNSVILALLVQQSPTACTHICWILTCIQHWLLCFNNEKGELMCIYFTCTWLHN